MATYIGFNTTLNNKISLTGFHYVVDSSGKSHSIGLMPQGNPFSIAGGTYVVYMISGAGDHNLNNRWFVHLHNNSGITSISNLPPYLIISIFNPCLFIDFSPVLSLKFIIYMIPPYLILLCL